MWGYSTKRKGKGVGSRVRLGVTKAGSTKGEGIKAGRHCRNWGSQLGRRNNLILLQ